MSEENLSGSESNYIFKTKQIALNLKLTELGITAQDMLHNYNLKDDCFKFTSNWPAKQPVKNTICFPTVEYSTVDLFFCVHFILARFAPVVLST